MNTSVLKKNITLKGKLGTVLELKSSPEEFLNLWKDQAHQVANHSPTNIQGVHVHEGDWVTPGSIKVWNYTVDGKVEDFKEKIVLDEEKKMVTIIGLEGDVFKICKVYTAIWELITKGQGSLAKLTLEYEKLNENVPVPHNYTDLVISMTKDIDEGISMA
ncbi:MLP-like protein 328 [Hevea brasiliensis]|uniref:MLP-like protein 328 n=1 Tax=Hevea brasiliensis TaxID=3981 RepID=UPI0025F1C08A|nr:MLP-like protein 328 [Hevea brasiliensis]